MHDSFYPDPFAPLEQTADAPDGLLPEWYDSTAAMIDPTYGTLYDASKAFMHELVEDENGYEEFTYYGLPAAAASPTAMEDYY